MHYAKTASRLRSQILRFSGELSAGLPKPARRFVAEMIYSIQTRQSVRLTEALCRMTASRIQELTLLILGISDVTKKYARRMEYLAGVHDGSEGRIASGYWTVQVVGAEPGKSRCCLFIAVSTPSSAMSSGAKTRR